MPIFLISIMNALFFILFNSNLYKPKLGTGKLHKKRLKHGSFGGGLAYGISLIRNVYV